MMNECAICVQPYNRVRKPVQCPRCDAVACTTCTKTFLLGNTIQAKCMSCQSAWDMEFVRAHLSKSFLDGDYRKHQMASLVSENMATLGELQVLVPIRHAMDEKEETVRELDAEVKIIRDDMRKLQLERLQTLALLREKTKTSTINRKVLKERRITLVQQISLKEQERQAILRKLYETRRDLGGLAHRWRHNGVGAMLAAHQDKHGTASRNVFFMACPGKNCRGRLSTGYKCGLCEHKFCPDCHGDKGTTVESAVDSAVDNSDKGTKGHTCNEDDKKTVTLLKENTKPCPKCHEGIFKVSGCDQMWCTQCHTCFSWQSGKILNGVVHNPHFYAWQRAQHGGEVPRVPGDNGDNPCGGQGVLPPFHVVMERIAHVVLYKHQQYLQGSHRLANHLLCTVINGLRRTLEEDTEEYRRKWGVEYLRARISKEEWAGKLYFAARRQERKQRILHLVEMVVGTTGDIFRSWPSTDEVLCSLETLYKYANEQMDVQNHQYGTKLRHLDPMAEEHYTVA